MLPTLQQLLQGGYSIDLKLNDKQIKDLSISPASELRLMVTQDGLIFLYDGFLVELKGMLFLLTGLFHHTQLLFLLNPNMDLREKFCILFLVVFEP